MSNNTVLITGGAGFIGSNFIHHLKKTYPTYRIINVDKLTYASNLNNLLGVDEYPDYVFVKADIANKEAMENVFEQYNPDYVINFAAESHEDRSIEGPELFVKTNVYGTQILLECARTFWKEDKLASAKFLQISTDEVYGSLPLSSTDKFTEQSPLLPNNPYSASKAGADLLCKAYFNTYDFPVLITRSSNNFGPRQYPEKLIPLLINNALLGKGLPIYGDGLNVRDWLFVEDNCRAIDIVLHSGKPGEIYNIGADNEWNNIELVYLLCELLAEELGMERDWYKRFIVFVKDRPGHDKKYSLNFDKIQNELGWQPIFDFKESLKTTIQWHIGQYGKI
ncbi:MAG: dTDP-glucose 4,6-dehydratase [candidate division WS2 bacterium]|uniref:dTDP-glucose 4,6-dehydratase n=1 Tax=Psychracetigena formicireducens TaxID=2986056 RepID=A0A9E2BJR8_PSYF1|nr:dTDP-glucose 4,6-dehydratase [Candidatus Psychracetigena formicireducens]MBT9145765.1 dTDP-glucose 4,6-dehydratase [Candidatus Psychracetigena formicireducens]MBT9151370.1 dTDP-glucose 4,6-dehydratase [Candidatus Psychracetigena formicireducens]